MSAIKNKIEINLITTGTGLMFFGLWTFIKFFLTTVFLGIEYDDNINEGARLPATIIAIIAVVIWLAIRSSNTNPTRNTYFSSSRTSNLSNTPSTNEVFEMIQDLFKDLSLNQRYAVYNFFDSLAHHPSDLSNNFHRNYFS